MAQKRYVVIRTDADEKAWIWEEIQAGRLRQGWGTPGMALVRDGGEIPAGDWVTNYRASAQQYWPGTITPPDEEESTARYRILARMMKLEREDVVVVPRVPTWETFLVAVVSEGYRFDNAPASEREGYEDYRHVIGVDKERLRVQSYHGSEDGRIVQRFMVAYQSAVNNANSLEFRAAVERLLQRPPGDTVAKPSFFEVFRKTRRGILTDVLATLRQRPPEDLEAIVGKTFEEAGYRLLDTHRYDGQGGDADLVMTRDLPILSRFADSASNIYIQVKQRRGDNPNDQEDVKWVEQLLKITSEDPGATRVLAATVDEFSAPCVQLCKDHRIVRLAGADLAELITKYL